MSEGTEELDKRYITGADSAKEKDTYIDLRRCCFTLSKMRVDFVDYREGEDRPWYFRVHFVDGTKVCRFYPNGYWGCYYENNSLDPDATAERLMEWRDRAWHLQYDARRVEGNHWGAVTALKESLSIARKEAENLRKQLCETALCHEKQLDRVRRWAEAGVDENAYGPQMRELLTLIGPA